MSFLTTLEAVNEILRAIKQPEASALDTGGTSLRGLAEAELDRSRRRVLERDGPGVQISETLVMPGWAENVEWDIDLNFASVSLTGTISSGTFIKGERVTQASSGAVGLIVDAYTVGDTTFLIAPVEGSADFDGSNNITGGSSGASTATVTNVSNPTAGVIPLEDDVLHWRPYLPSSVNSYYLTVRNQRLYDLDDKTDQFDAKVNSALTRLLDFSELSSLLQDYVVAYAAWRFHRDHPANNRRDQQLAQQLAMARAAAVNESTDVKPVNVLRTRHARLLTGRRHTPIR